MKSAAQYRLRFIPHQGRVTSISDVVFLLHDAPQPGLVKSVRNKPDELTLNLNRDRRFDAHLRPCRRR